MNIRQTIGPQSERMMERLYISTKFIIQFRSPRSIGSCVRISPTTRLYSFQIHVIKPHKRICVLLSYTSPSFPSSFVPSSSFSAYVPFSSLAFFCGVCSAHWDMRNVYKSLVRTLEGKRPILRPRLRWRIIKFSLGN